MERRTFNNLILGATIMGLQNTETNAAVTLNNFELHRSEERGSGDHGWLKSKHSFSFANYYNPKHMGFSDLRVINEDRVSSGRGFGMHGHKNMEIFSYVLEGQLQHKDSMGNGEVIIPGDVQLMSAGTGVMHSEFNPSPDNGVHFLQIWIMPKENGGQPSYQQKNFDNTSKRGNLKLIISEAGENGSLKVKQNAKVYAGLFDGEESAKLEVDVARSQYIHLVKGQLKVNGIELNGGDALKIYGNNKELFFHDGKDAEVLVFDLNKH
jgi:redox-sensitive bicupin YhaK (pirin superfamily)